MISLNNAVSHSYKASSRVSSNNQDVELLDSQTHSTLYSNNGNRLNKINLLNQNNSNNFNTSTIINDSVLSSSPTTPKTSIPVSTLSISSSTSTSTSVGPRIGSLPPLHETVQIVDPMIINHAVVDFNVNSSIPALSSTLSSTISLLPSTHSLPAQARIISQSNRNVPPNHINPNLISNTNVNVNSNASGTSMNTSSVSSLIISPFPRPGVHPPPSLPFNSPTPKSLSFAYLDRINHSHPQLTSVQMEEEIRRWYRSIGENDDTTDGADVLFDVKDCGDWSSCWTDCWKWCWTAKKTGIKQSNNENINNSSISATTQSDQLNAHSTCQFVPIPSIPSSTIHTIMKSSSDDKQASDINLTTNYHHHQNNSYQNHFNRSIPQKKIINPSSDGHISNIYSSQLSLTGNKSSYIQRHQQQHHHQNQQQMVDMTSFPSNTSMRSHIVNSSELNFSPLPPQYSNPQEKLNISTPKSSRSYNPTQNQHSDINISLPIQSSPYQSNDNSTDNSQSDKENEKGCESNIDINSNHSNLTSIVQTNNLPLPSSTASTTTTTTAAIRMLMSSSDLSHSSGSTLSFDDDKMLSLDSKRKDEDLTTIVEAKQLNTKSTSSTSTSTSSLVNSFYPSPLPNSIHSPPP